MKSWVRLLRVLGMVVIFPASERAAEREVTALDPFNVTTDRFEEFGFLADDVFPEPGLRRRSPFGTPIIGIVKEVRPNTAAAKAGLRPGDRILKSDGRVLAVSLLEENKWRRLPWEKFVEARSGREVKWTLEIQSADLQSTRIVVLCVPSPPPRWGASVWQPPVGRDPATVSETGPLAERAREVLNHGVWAMLDPHLARQLGLLAGKPDSLLGFYWDIHVPVSQRSRMLHRLFVSQQRGRTDVILTVRSSTDRGVPEKHYLTSPGGTLEKAWGTSGGKSTGGKSQSAEVAREEAAAGFQREVDFWLRQVGKVSPRWPLELMP